jgi:hypothetical protein
VETRYQGRRGKAPFEPVEPERQRQAVRFLIDRAFTEPKPLLDPDVLNRIVPAGGSAPLQGSNVELLRRLIDPDVFGRMREASSMGNGRYTGVELLEDLNDGLFSELDSADPAVSPYRRQVQRSYVAVLLTATGTIEDPERQSANIDNEYADSGSHRESTSKLKSARSFDSWLAYTGDQYSHSADAISEYRAVLRTAVALLYKKIDAGLARTQDTDTQMHLRLIRALLADVS